MMLVHTVNGSRSLTDEAREVDQIIKAIHALIFEDEFGRRLSQAQELTARCRDLISRFAERVQTLSVDPSRENVLETSKYLKLQSRLAVAMGASVKHVTNHVRAESLRLKNRTR